MSALTGRPLDRDSPVPLWFQIAEQLRQAIEGGQLLPGDRLENEMEISEHLGVSRPTVRQAIHSLVERDLLVRRRGVGTTVATRRIKRPVALTSLYDDLRASGRRPSTRVLSVREGVADAHLAKRLDLEPGSPVVRLERLRLAEGRPLALMKNVIPCHLLQKPLLADDLEAAGLYEILRDQGVTLSSAQQVISARSATSREACLLETGRSATVLTMARTAYDSRTNTVEFGEHSYLAARYSFEITLWLK